MIGSPLHGGLARDLLAVLALIAWVAVTAIAVMTAIATDALIGPAVLTATALAGAAVIIPGVARRRHARGRRELRRRVGDPRALAGTWRRQLVAAWTARDDYVAAAADLDGSPLRTHVTAHASTVDAALARCGQLARDGHRLSGQLRRFRPRHLRRAVRLAERNDRDGTEMRALAARLAEVERVERAIAELEVRLDAQVHQLQTASWRATALRSALATEADEALDDLVTGLALVRAALDEVAAPPQAPSRVDTRHDLGSGPASATGLRYDT